MIFTSEQVSAGHPDKICDQISDAIVTECLRYDKNSRVAIETVIKDYNVVIVGELTTKARVEYFTIVRDVLKRIGLSNIGDYKFFVNVSQQSGDIAMGVDDGGAGDQGMMFGYATNETPEMLPLPYAIATDALRRLRDLENPLLLPDAKAQVSYDYDKMRIDTFLISTQHREEVSLEQIRDICERVMKASAKSYGQNTDFKVLVNPTGRFVKGSSFADSGVTGRKIIADTYGGMARHGGGAFSGKDPSKVDRSGAYMARKIAKDVVRLNLADKCEVQIAYAIGVKEPVSVLVDCFGTEKQDNEKIEEFIKNSYDLTPRGIIERLGLLDVDYTKTSCYGHFGKPELPWEE